MLDKLVLWGTPERVADRILALREEAGPFGEIVYANMDWVDERLARRSIELMATEVMPRVNAAITGSTASAKAA
jgi:alkanesulfonate monooxygenase SsuD/methylene tetrahydromethanopterin reductase-like flavin-dependent oxidoreductase (luciferase family)